MTLTPSLIESNNAMRRYLRTNATAASLALNSNVGGPMTITAIEAVLGSGIVDRGRLNGRSGIKVAFFGTDGNDETGSYRVWVGRFLFGFGGQVTDEAFIWPLGNGAITLGSAAGSGSGSAYAVSTSELFADTLTWAPSTTSTTPDGPEEVFGTAFLTDGANKVYSPADNSSALLELNNLGRADFFLIEMATGGSASSLNALVGSHLV